MVHTKNNTYSAILPKLNYKQHKRFFFQISLKMSLRAFSIHQVSILVVSNEHRWIQNNVRPLNGSLFFLGSSSFLVQFDAERKDRPENPTRRLSRHPRLKMGYTLFITRIVIRIFLHKKIYPICFNLMRFCFNNLLFFCSV